MVSPTPSGPRGARLILAALAPLLVLLPGCREPAGPPPAFAPQLGERHATRASVQSAAGGAAAQGPATAQVPLAAIDRPAMVRFHMQWHFDDLRTIERMLVDGNLEEAKARAFLLTRPAQDPGLAQWQPAAQRVVEAAAALSRSASLAEAYRREPRVAAECARCHIAMQRVPVFRPPPPPPLDAGTQEARMARHQWAVDRLWEAVVGDSELAWRSALAVLAETPPPGDQPQLAKRLQDLAKRRQTARPTPLDDRTTAYGELLGVCGACHATRAGAGR